MSIHLLYPSIIYPFIHPYIHSSLHPPSYPSSYSPTQQFIHLLILLVWLVFIVYFVPDTLLNFCYGQLHLVLTSIYEVQYFILYFMVLQLYFTDEEIKAQDTVTYSSHTDHTGRVGTHVHLPISHQELFFPTTTNLAALFWIAKVETSSEVLVE